MLTAPFSWSPCLEHLHLGLLNSVEGLCCPHSPGTMMSGLPLRMLCTCDVPRNAWEMSGCPRHRSLYDALTKHVHTPAHTASSSNA